MDPETEQSERDRYKAFLKERSLILEDIKQFLKMVLTYFLFLEGRWGYEPVVNAINIESVKSLIKSLCLVHGLYGYPADNDNTANRTRLEFNIDDIIYRIANNADKPRQVQKLTNEAKKLLRNTVINKDAVKNILKNEIKSKYKVEENATIGFEHYCKEAIRAKEFWEFKFSDETFNLEALPREPAHCFLQLVRDMFNNHHELEKAPVVGRECLESLPDKNYLKPVMWAEHTQKPECYGVSLGVRCFVRPLYLCTKLTRLRNIENGELEDDEAEDEIHYVRSIQIRYKKVRDPCVSCHVFFGFTSFPPLGNCAEYDVIENVNHTGLQLLQTDQWKEFRSACQQHFNAFKTMLTMIEERKYSSEEIIKKYFDLTRDPMKPKVLRCEWNSAGKVFELKTKDWPPPRPQ